MVYILSVLFNFSFARSPIVLVDAVSRILHAKDTDVQVRRYHVHLLMRNMDIFSVAMKVEHQLWGGSRNKNCRDCPTLGVMHHASN